MNSAANWAATLANVSMRDWLDPILDQLPVGFIIIEAPSGRVLEGNQQLEVIFRHPVRYSTGVADFGEWVGYHPDGRKYLPHEWPVARALSGEITTGEEVAINRGDSTRGFISIDAAPVRDEDGTIVAALAIIQDITERKRLEERERQTAKRLQDMLEITTDCVFMLDREWRFTFMNQRAICEIAGGRDLTGLIIWGEYPDAVSSPFWDNYQRAMNKREAVTFEAYYPPPLANWYRVHAFPSDEGIAVFFRNITVEREAAQAQLRSEEGLRSALRAARSSSFEWDIATGYCCRSDTAEDILGIGSGRATAFFERVHPDDVAGLQKAVQQAGSQGAAETVEVRFRKPDGNEIWLSVWIHAELDQEGRPIRVFGLDQDITERKVAEQELQRTGIALQVTLDNMVDGLVMVDSNGVLQVCNRRAIELLDLPPSLATSNPLFSELVAHQVAIGEFADASEEGTPWLRLNGDLRGVPPVYERARPNGTVLEIKTVQLADGGLVRTFTDITSRKQSEAAVRESEVRYRLLAENATDLISRLKLDGTVLYASPSSRDILGYEPEKMIGCELTSVTHPDDEARVRAAIPELLASRDGHQTIAYRVRHQEGHWITLEAHRRLVRDETGRPVEFVSVARDITEQRRLEEQLRQSQKMEAVGQLTGGIAHDFNNLLTVILGNAEILVEEIQDVGHRALASMTAEAASRAAELTQKLLAFGRRHSLKPEPVVLGEVVHGMAGLLKRTLGAHVEIRLAGEECRSAALTDRALLESALLNLAVNGRDAMPKGGALTINTGERLAVNGDGSIPVGQPVVFVTVSDTGCGMSPEVMARAFEPFFTTKDVGHGTGLGLAMVYGFAQQSGGHVSIESREGEGTSVTIVLRVVGKEEVRATGDDRTLLTKGNERMLVVEDEPSVRQFVEIQLTGLGYDVASVATGHEALDLLERGERFDLMFSDVLLPKGISGVELSRLAVARCPGLKVLLTSGYSEEVFQHHGRPEEGTPLLRKPYRRRDLAETVRNALND